MTLHSLSYLLGRENDRAEASLVQSVSDVIIPAIHDLLEKQAEEVLKDHEYPSPFAKTIAMEIMIEQIACMVMLAHVDYDECIRPHMLTKTNARYWLGVKPQESSGI